MIDTETPTARQLAEEHAARTGMSFSESWNIIRHREPQLFGLRATGSPVENRRFALLTEEDSNVNNRKILNGLSDDARCESAADGSETITHRQHAHVLHEARGREGLTLTQRCHSGNYRGVRNRESAPASADAPLSSGDLADAIDDFKSQHPELRHAQAVEILRNRRPGLFGC